MPLYAFENEAFTVDGLDRAYLSDTLGGYFERRDEGWAVCRVVGHLRLPSGETLFIRSRKAPAAAPVPA